MTSPQAPCHHVRMRILMLLPVLLLAACKPDGPGYYAGPGYHGGRGVPPGYWGPRVVSPPLHAPVYLPPSVPQPGAGSRWGRSPANTGMGD